MSIISPDGREFQFRENTMTDDPTSSASAAWAGLRPAVRARLAAAVAHAFEHGSIRRADICRIGEVTVTQASADFAEIGRRLPGLLVRDTRARAYVVAGRGVAPAEPRAEPGPAGDVRAIRLALELTQSEFAAALGLGSTAYVSEIERGRRVPSVTVARLAEMYRRHGVPTDFIVRVRGA